MGGRFAKLNHYPSMVAIMAGTGSRLPARLWYPFDTFQILNPKVASFSIIIGLRTGIIRLRTGIGLTLMVEKDTVGLKAIVVPVVVLIEELIIIIEDYDIFSIVRTMRMRKELPSCCSVRRLKGNRLLRMHFKIKIRVPGNVKRAQAQRQGRRGIQKRSMPMDSGVWQSDAWPAVE